MSPIATSAVRIVRASATPLRAAAIRQYSAAAGESSSAPAALHSTKKLAIASGVAFAVGVDVTYAYFTLSQKSKFYAGVSVCSCEQTNIVKKATPLTLFLFSLLVNYVEEATA